MTTAQATVKAELHGGPRDGARMDVPKPLPAVLRVNHEAGTAPAVLHTVERYQYEGPVTVKGTGETVPRYRYVRP
jgi:hypothetical protein